MKGKWIVQLKGQIEETSWELSVIREDNEHGRRSWGWFDKNKHLISHNGGHCSWPLAPGAAVKLLQVAREVMDELNEKEFGKVQVRVCPCCQNNPHFIDQTDEGDACNCRLCGGSEA